MNFVTGVNTSFGGSIKPNIVRNNLGDGVLITDGAHNNTIGGPGYGAGNLITQNGDDGIELIGDSIAITAWGRTTTGGYLTLALADVEGLYVGQTLSITGLLLIDPISLVPVEVTGPVTIAAIDAGMKTVTTSYAIGATLQGPPAGYLVVGAPHHNTVQGNWIGVSQAGASLGNNGDGIFIDGGAHDTTVAGNTIAYNGKHDTTVVGSGVRIGAGAHDNVVGNASGAVTSATKNDIHHNTASGVFIDGGNNNTVGGNDVHHNLNGILLTKALANTIIGDSIHDNGENGVANGGEGVNLNQVLSCAIEDNADNGVMLADGAEGNLVLGCTIEGNGGDGILLANGAEGNSIGLHLTGDGAGIHFDDSSPLGPNTIQNNHGYQVHFDGTSTRFNFVAGGNVIRAGLGVGDQPTAVKMSGDASCNSVGNGGEGFYNVAGEYIVPRGNEIEFREGGHGVEALVHASSNGGEGAAVIGNSFIGDLDDAISIGTSSSTYQPPTLSFSIDDGELTVEYVAQTTDQGHARLDFYLLNPTTGGIFYLHGVLDFDPASGTQSLGPIDLEDEFGLASLDGWYLAATATYQLNTTASPVALKIGSITSPLAFVALVSP